MRRVQLTPEEQAWVQAGLPETERIARERQQAARAERAAILGGQELISDVVRLVDDAETLAARWSRKGGFTLNSAEAAVLGAELARLRAAADRLAEQGRGRRLRRVEP